MRRHTQRETGGSTRDGGQLRRRCIILGLLGFMLPAVAGIALAVRARVPATEEDFHLPGTQDGDIDTRTLQTSRSCALCHANLPEGTDPYSNWAGSLMAQGARDPLFFAQMATANQDVEGVGYFCLRCHAPIGYATGHAEPTDGSALDVLDREGINCHFCHALVDPIYKPGESPPEDEAILAGLDAVPTHYANSMFVLDPSGTRRGPRADAAAPHDLIRSKFHESSSLCGTCHDVGNLAVTRQPDGTYRYNSLDEPSPTQDPRQQFPLERTYTEWKLSTFNNGGVDMGGRFNGPNGGVIKSCQHCHMPKFPGRAAIDGPQRPGVHVHTFAGSAAQVLDLIAEQGRTDPEIDRAAIARGRAAAVDMLERAVSLEVAQQDAVLTVRVINETGHKLPTGHIEGRRVWVNVRFLDRRGGVIKEHGRYNVATAELDEGSTTVYQMHVGLSADAARATGLQSGPTGHMALADTIEFDNRIPPRGFANTAFAAAGAPVVGWAYNDGQHWDDSRFPIPVNTTQAAVTVYYQTTPRHYIEELRDNNVTNNAGETLYRLWEKTGKGAPIPMASATLALTQVAKPRPGIVRPTQPSTGTDGPPRQPQVGHRPERPAKPARPARPPRPTLQMRPRPSAEGPTQPHQPRQPTKPARPVR